jgi:hypothetical protein
VGDTLVAQTQVQVTACNQARRDALGHTVLRKQVSIHLSLQPRVGRGQQCQAETPDKRSATRSREFARSPSTTRAAMPCVQPSPATNWGPNGADSAARIATHVSTSWSLRSPWNASSWHQGQQNNIIARSCDRIAWGTSLGCSSHNNSARTHTAHARIHSHSYLPRRCAAGLPAPQSALQHLQVGGTLLRQRALQFQRLCSSRRGPHERCALSPRARGKGGASQRGPNSPSAAACARARATSYPPAVRQLGPSRRQPPPPPAPGPPRPARWPRRPPAWPTILRGWRRWLAPRWEARPRINQSGAPTHRPKRCGHTSTEGATSQCRGAHTNSGRQEGGGYRPGALHGGGSAR